MRASHIWLVSIQGVQYKLLIRVCVAILEISDLLQCFGQVHFFPFSLRFVALFVLHLVFGLSYFYFYFLAPLLSV